MNINEYLKEYGDVSAVTAKHLLVRRQITFKGFCQVEKKNMTGVDNTAHLSSPAGQESIRLLFARVIEEFMESCDSQDPDHVLEELIDMVNYGLSMAFLEGYEKLEKLEQGLDLILHDKRAFSRFAPYPNYDRDAEMLFEMMWKIFPMLEKLRARAWQNGQQHPYFLGQDELTLAIFYIVRTACAKFKNSEQFIKFFLAKDDVLQFRLSTNY